MPRVLKLALSEDAIVLTEEFTAEGKTAGETTGIRHSADAGRLLAVDLDKETSRIVGSTTARTRPGETGTKEVCERLLQRLNQDARFIKWECCEPVKVKSETDCVVHPVDGSAALKIQVTRGVPGTTGIWKSSSGTVEAVYEFTFEAASEHIRTALKDKAGHYALQDKRELLLAIDMLETPGHALEQIIQRLDAAWISSLGFKEIWLVGLTPTLCVRLHPR